MVLNHKFPSTVVDAGAQRAISTVYETDAVDWTTVNVVLLCPFIRLFNSSGKPFTEICDGWEQDAVFDHKRGLRGGRFSSRGAAQLLPATVSNCYIDPFSE
jgi:hypothetical protein